MTGANFKYEEKEFCVGSFLICHDPPDTPEVLESMLYLSKASLAEALEEVSDIAAKSDLTISGYSIPKDETPSLDAKWLEKYAHKQLNLHPEEDKRSGL